MSQNNCLAYLAVPQSNSRKQKTKLEWIESYTSAFQGKQAANLLLYRADLKKRILEKEIAHSSSSGNLLEKIIFKAEKWLFSATHLDNSTKHNELLQLKSVLQTYENEKIFLCSDNTERTEFEIAVLKSNTKHLCALVHQSHYRLEKITTAWNDVVTQVNALIIPNAPENITGFLQIKHLHKLMWEIMHGIDTFVAEYRHRENVADCYINASPLKSRILTLSRALHPKRIRTNNVLIAMFSKTPLGQEILGQLLYPTQKLIPCQKPDIKKSHRMYQQKTAYNTPYRTPA